MNSDEIAQRYLGQTLRAERNLKPYVGANNLNHPGDRLKPTEKRSFVSR